MGISDLLNLLQQLESKLDGATAAKISKVVLQELDDSSMDVSGLAVKWYLTILCHLAGQSVIFLSSRFQSRSPC